MSRWKNCFIYNLFISSSGSRQVEWYPLKEIVGLPPPNATIGSEESKANE
jgi:hypothetical protein